MHVLLRGDITQRLRIASGLVLFTFATTHFLNHALGLINIELMHEAQQWRWVVTRSLPGTALLLMALVTHMTLALYKLANRSTLRLPPWELIQIGNNGLASLLCRVCVERLGAWLNGEDKQTTRAN